MVRRQMFLLVLAAVFALPLAAQWDFARPAKVVSLTGTLTVRRSREAARPLRLQDAVASGDELITGQNSEAMIQAWDGSTVRVFPDSHVIFNERSADIQEFLHLFLGSIKVHIEKLSGRPNPQKMTTPTAVIAVRGTTFSVFVDETEATLVAVDEGEVSVANVASPSQEVILRKGQRTWVQRGQPPVVAQRFRGRSERADLIPGLGRQAGSGEPMGAPPGGRMAGMDMMGLAGSQSMGGAMPRSGPVH
ncbi:MAG: FecR domain-containing protein [Acidobacteria bacterium]|nr:FecR domain-containing protein [Acidobacteriota bacterium]